MIDNLSHKEKDAIKKLKETQYQSQFTIKEADKGGGICIINMDDYITKMDNQPRTVFKIPDGTESQFYVVVKEDSLIKKKTDPVYSVVKNP